MRLSRLMSVATAGYAVFAAVRPEHLGDAVGAHDAARPAWGALARTYAGRDLAVSAAGVCGPAPVVSAAMGMRIAMDLTDCAALLLATEDAAVRRKIAGVTIGWATLNTLALLADRRRD